MRRARLVLLVGGLLSASAAAGSHAATGCSTHWVGSWAASPSDAAAQALANQTVRMIVAPHLAGKVVRVRLSNRFGSSPVTLERVAVGLRGSGAALVLGSARTLSFGGRSTVTIPAGQGAVSDPVHLTFGAFQDLAISVFVAGSAATPTEHFTTRQTSYLTPGGAGDHAGDVDGAAFSQKTTTAYSNGWYFLEGVDVLAPAGTGAVVAFGDSITDGFQGNTSPVTEELSTIDTDGRYPDDLARRLIAAGSPISVLNAGISGNRVTQDGQTPQFGPRGVFRFADDALRQPGATSVIVLEGINDIGQTTGITADAIIAGCQDLIRQAHAAGVPIQLGTLTPAGGTILSTYGGSGADQLRQQINQWIRTQRLADGVVDFDAAVRDPSDPSRINPPYDGSDHLHFSLAGYRAMANAIDLSTLTKPACHGGTSTPAVPRCTKRRTVRVQVPRRYRRRLRRATVTVDGRRVTTLSPGRTSYRFSLGGASGRVVTVRLRLRLRDGRTIAQTSRYRIC